MALVAKRRIFPLCRIHLDLILTVVILFMASGPSCVLTLDSLFLLRCSSALLLSAVLCVWESQHSFPSAVTQGKYLSDSTLLI